MTQNIYDNPDFFANYAQLGRSVHGLDGAAEWPALQAMLPNMHGVRVVDLGCGYGWFCRWAAEQGARSVLGLDVSQKMLERARATTGDARIQYAQADLEQLALPECSVDLVYSSLTLHYLKDLPGLLAAAHKALVPGGHLVFSIEHPIFMAARHADWVTTKDGRKTWPVDSYQREGERVTNWLADGVVKQHRTLGTLLNAVIDAGFTLAHIEDWGPTAQQLATVPALADEVERPMLLLVGAHR